MHTPLGKTSTLSKPALPRPGTAVLGHQMRWEVFLWEDKGQDFLRFPNTELRSIQLALGTRDWVYLHTYASYVDASRFLKLFRSAPTGGQLCHGKRSAFSSPG